VDGVIHHCAAARLRPIHEPTAGHPPPVGPCDGENPAELARVHLLLDPRDRGQIAAGEGRAQVDARAGTRIDHCAAVRNGGCQRLFAEDMLARSRGIEGHGRVLDVGRRDDDRVDIASLK